MSRPCKKRRKKKPRSLLKKFRYWSRTSFPTQEQWDDYEYMVTYGPTYDKLIERAMVRALTIYNSSLIKLELQQNDEVEFARLIISVMQIREVMTTFNIDLNVCPSPPLKGLDGLVETLEIMES